MKQKNKHTSYLDVSEFVLKEHSPLFKPRPIEQPIEVIIFYCIVVNIASFSKLVCLRCATTILFIFLYFYYLDHSSNLLTFA
jgi:hypothetical protein